MEIIWSSLFKIELSMNLNNIARITNVGVQCILFFDSALKDLSLITVIACHCCLFLIAVGSSIA